MSRLLCYVEISIFFKFWGLQTYCAAYRPFAYCERSITSHTKNKQHTAVHFETLFIKHRIEVPLLTIPCQVGCQYIKWFKPYFIWKSFVIIMGYPVQLRSNIHAKVGRHLTWNRFILSFPWFTALFFPRRLFETEKRES